MVQKVFVNKDQMASFTCPKCKKVKRMDVSKFCGNEKEVRLNFKCKCTHSFPVVLERRQYIRKPVCLLGNVVRDRKKYAMKVEDLSRYGMRIRLLDKNVPVTVDEVLEIEFNLDDANKTLVNKEVIIQTVMPKNLGVKFKSTDHYDKFGKYLLFHFG